MLKKFFEEHQSRIVGLDILRSIAILQVVYIHGAYLLPARFVAPYKMADPLQIDGVSIFFVLSGFLIGGILLKTISTSDFTRTDLFNFWIRRWFRTIPNYLLILLILVAYRALVFPDMRGFTYKYFLFSQNLFSPHPGFFNEAWSLTVEEWFYLLFPLLCFALIRLGGNKHRSILISAITFLVVPLLLRIIKFESGVVQDFDEEIRHVVVFRLDSLMYGVIGAYIAFENTALWTKLRMPLLVVGIVLIVLDYFNPADWKFFYMPLTINIEAIMTFCFLPFLSSYKTTQVKIIDAFFIFISVISYSMYLINYTLIQAHALPIINSLPGRKDLPAGQAYPLNYFLFWTLTIAGSYLLYTLYESRMTKLRDKFTR